MPRSRTHTHRVILPALCWNRHHPDFYAVTDAVCAEGILFRSATLPAAGNVLTCSIRHIGLLEVRVERLEAQAFVARIAAGPAHCRAVARDLLVLAREQRHGLETPRAHPRIVPRESETLITLQGGAILPGRLLNVSASGAALRLGAPVEVGAEIHIGATAATVVRSFSDGIGAVFTEPLDPFAVHENIRL